MNIDELERGNVQANTDLAHIQRLQQSMSLQDQERGLIQEQLSVEDVLEKIQNLLRGKIQMTSPDGTKYWKEPEDKTDILLTEAGIHLVMNTVEWYINRNTMLSNFDEETILAKMEDFGTSLADALFMNYEKYFEFPSLEVCNTELKKRIKNRVKSKIFDSELRNEEYNVDKFYDQVVSSMDLAVERQKIREQLMKNKLKGYDLLIREIIDAVHSTYNRAFGGQERRTLRQHIHVSETKGSPTQENPSRANPFGWLKPR